MSTLKITNTVILGNRIEVHFEPGEKLNPFFPERVFWLEYTENMEGIPPSIAIIPFVCNILPIVWVTNSVLIVDEIDADFYRSIPQIRKGYAEMYRKVDFLGSIDAAKIIENRIASEPKRSLAFFSGGVDANCTLISHLDESPDLMVIWGADISIDNNEAWRVVSQHIHRVAQEFDLNAVEVKSNFRTFIDPDQFPLDVQSKWDCEYWHRLQHGIGIIGHAAPYCFVKNISIIYLGSTFSPAERERPGHACASDPTIDEQVRFFGSTIIHDQSDCTRQQKINRIVEFSRCQKKRVALRVCWESSEGNNCCHCEKCYRTIIGILLAGGDPNEYGLQTDVPKLLEIEFRINNRIHVRPPAAIIWRDLTQEYRKGKVLPSYDQHLRWLTNFQPQQKRANRFVILYRSGLYKVRRFGYRLFTPQDSRKSQE